MKDYVELKIEVVTFIQNDIITTSFTNNEDDIVIGEDQLFG